MLSQLFGTMVDMYSILAGEAVVHRLPVTNDEFIKLVNAEYKRLQNDWVPVAKSIAKGSTEALGMVVCRAPFKMDGTDFVPCIEDVAANVFFSGSIPKGAKEEYLYRFLYGKEDKNGNAPCIIKPDEALVSFYDPSSEDGTADGVIHKRPRQVVDVKIKLDYNNAKGDAAKKKAWEAIKPEATIYVVPHALNRSETHEGDGAAHLDALRKSIATQVAAQFQPATRGLYCEALFIGLVTGFAVNTKIRKDESGNPDGMPSLGIIMPTWVMCAREVKWRGQNALAFAAEHKINGHSLLASKKAILERAGVLAKPRPVAPLTPLAIPQELVKGEAVPENIANAEVTNVTEVTVSDNPPWDTDEEITDPLAGEGSRNKKVEVTVIASPKEEPKATRPGAGGTRPTVVTGGGLKGKSSHVKKGAPGAKNITPENENSYGDIGSVSEEG